MGQKLVKEAIQPKNPLTAGEKLLLDNNLVIVRVWTSGKIHSIKSHQLEDTIQIGHVSIEMTKPNKPGSSDDYTYISFWPYKEFVPQGVQYEPDNDNNLWSYMKTYSDDRLMERKPPEYTFCFYSLNISAIKRAFSTFKSNTLNAWGLFGQYLPRKSSHDAEGQLESHQTKESCVSLACLCLDSGGINALIGVKEEVYASSVGMSRIGVRTSKHFSQLEFIQPSQESTVYVGEHLLYICGFCVSPDVMVERLKEAKRNELENNEKIKLIPPKCFIWKKVTDSSGLSEECTTSKDNELDSGEEVTYEWLP